MNLIKNLFAAMVLVMSLGMIACQGDADDAREQARASLAENDGRETQISSTPSNVEATQVNAEASTPTGPTTTMTFEYTDYDFGSVKEGEKVKHSYKFKNTGKEPLVISSAKGSCGCTVPKWPTEPIAPGESGQIDVEFDSKGKPGKQTKQVTVVANTTPDKTFLKISGTVEKDPNAATAQGQPVQVQK